MAKSTTAQQFFYDQAEMTKQERVLAQCYLMSNVSRLLKEKELESDCFQNFLAVMDDPSVFLGRAMRNSLKEVFLEGILPYELSSLVPEVRLWKVIYDPKNPNSYQQFEFNFDSGINEFDIQSITQSVNQRATGVGLKSCEWEFIGSNPAESKRLIKVSLKILFASMQDITKKSQNGIAFLDLIKPPIKTTFQLDELNPIHHQVKLRVGWAPPPAEHSIFRDKPELRQAIEDSRYDMFLSLVNHDLNFQQDGRVLLTANFWGRLESRMGGSGFLKFDVLEVHDKNKQKIRNLSNSLKASKSEIQARLDMLQCLRSSSEKKSDRKALRGLKIEESKALEKYKKIIEEQKNLVSEKKMRYENLVLQLMERKKIYYELVDNEAIGIFDDKVAKSIPNSSVSSRKCQTADYKKLDRSLQAQNKFRQNQKLILQNQKLSNKNLLETRLPKLDNKCTLIHYFFFGDLLDVILDDFYQNEKEFFTRFLVGSITDPSDNSRKISLADIPISLHRFGVWFSQAVINKSKDVYPFNEFIRDIIIGLIAPIMNESCLEPGLKQRITKIQPRLGLFNLSGQGKDGKIDPITKSNKTYKERVGLQRNTGVNIPGISAVLESCPNRVTSQIIETVKVGSKVKRTTDNQTKPQFDYYFIYVTEETKDYRKANYVKDLEDGIYHFFVGSDKGLLKNIKFTQNSQTYYKEAVMKGTNLAWLKRLYNADIEMYGNASFVPGQKVYVNPVSIGLGDPKNPTSIAADMGLGGYYVVINVRGQIESGKFDTQLKCVWESKGDGTGYKSAQQGTACLEEYKKKVGKDRGRFFFIQTTEQLLQYLRNINTPINNNVSTSGPNLGTWKYIPIRGF